MGPKSRRVPPELRQRTEHSCDRCKSRKQKCLTAPGETKCRHCQKYGYDCVVTKPRKQRLYGSVEMHSARVSILESLVKGLVPEADLTNIESMKQMARSLGIPLPDAASAAEARSSSSGSNGIKSEEEEELVHDLQGQDQYIGRASSYLFQMKLRSLVGKSLQETLGQMYLFGPNRAQANNRRRSGTSNLTEAEEETLDIISIGSVASPEPSPGSSGVQLGQTVIPLLVGIYFERINVDFPVLHEATFLEKLHAWFQSPGDADRVWLCSLLCVLILARRLSDVPISEDLEDAWWGRIQSLLSGVMFTSSLASIQAMMLAALHLHNTNSRDICWTLTGAAARIGFAIGLHRDDLKTNDSPLTREMRKRVWWTLYTFEQLQVSSHDRPTAIDNAKLLPSPPRETVLDMSPDNIPDYVQSSHRLVILLGAACRTVPDAAKDGSSGPLSPAAGLLRDLSRWRATLPSHLSMESIDTMPAKFRRQLILLHVQYHYIVSLISRYALLSRFNSVSKDRSTSLSTALISMSDVCNESGRLSCQLLLKLDSINSFNAFTWLDVYYLYSSTLVLVLSIICYIIQDKRSAAAESRVILDQCTDLAVKYLENPLVPGTMRRWLTVVSELKTMVIDFTEKREGKHSSMPSQVLVEGIVAEPTPQFVDPSPVADEGGTAVVVEAFKAFEVSELPPRMGFLVPELMPAHPPYDQHFPVVEETQGWHQLHWDNIEDMLLNGGAQSWNMQ